MQRFNTIAESVLDLVSALWTVSVQANFRLGSGAVRAANFFDPSRNDASPPGAVRSFQVYNILVVESIKGLALQVQLR